FHVGKCEPLPFDAEAFDFSLCSSVLEYATDRSVRQFCVREMVRLVRKGSRLFFSVPNRLYLFEVHSRQWGWNYFPNRLGARIVDCSFWEVTTLAKPARLALYRTPLVQLFSPWSNFCVRKIS